MSVHILNESAWVQKLADPRTRFVVNRQWFGQAVRRDGWSCRDRRICWHVIYVALEGRCVARSGKIELRVEPGMALWLPPGCPHDMDWTRVFRYCELWFSLSEGSRQFTPWAAPRQWTDASEARPWLDSAADELHTTRPHQAVRLRALVIGLCTQLFRQGEATAAATGLTTGQRARLLAYTREHLTDGLTAGDLAQCVGLERDYFGRLFRHSFGCPPRTWLGRERMRAAGRLLAESTQSVQQVARGMGYADVAQFSRQFRKVTGHSPRAYRRLPEARPPQDHTLS